MACVDVFALPLQLLLREHPTWLEHPAAVVDRDKSQGLLLWVNEAARQRRILPGMRANAARALDHQLRAGTVAPAAIERAGQEILRVLRVFSPGVEPSREEPGIFWLDASGLDRLHPSLERWAQLIEQDLRARRLSARIAVGFTRFGSYALARGLAGGKADSAIGPAKGIVVLKSPEEEMARAQRIPLARLDLPTRARDALHKLGVDQVGELVKLPQQGVRKRFGEAVHRLVRLALGDLWVPLQPIHEDDPVRATHRLDHGERNLDRLMAVIGRQLPPLLHTLAKRQRMLRAIEIHLRFESAPPRCETLQPATPTLQAVRVLELVRLRLEGIPLEDEVIELQLELQAATATRAQAELFTTHAQRDPAAAQRALARIRAELGGEAVLRAQLIDGHLPQAHFRWEPFEKLPTAVARPVHKPPLIRRLLPRPIPLSRQRRNEADGWMILGLEGGPVEEVIGPYVINGGWWRREIHREVHYIRTSRSGWLWVYFDRPRGRWFLQGSVE